MLPRPEPASPDSEQFAARIAAAGEIYNDANVAAIYCVHGTFAGTDTFGMLTELARYAPALGEGLQHARKRVFDFFARETGNYTPRFAKDFETALSGRLSRKWPIPVHLFNWSGLNNHIGRADGAIRLLIQLADHATNTPEALDHPLRPRFQLWGHSHGGNVLALLANLLAAGEKARGHFFTHSQRYYKSWNSKDVSLPAWEQARAILADGAHPLRSWKVDYVTFGTPLRYAWPESTDKLLSFVNHRPEATPLRATSSSEKGDANYLGPQQFHPLQLACATAGDYVHQVGIAGTNFPPVPFALRMLLADLSLAKLLEADLESEWLLSRIHHGRRVAGSGTTLLVDYHDQGLRPWHHILGHAVYTRRQWLALHCEEVARVFYA
ncbi:hypothetical protein [Adhaeretor mobilis]|uniref:Alpha/beta hydrolase n=1 Tax=Adhaeretor mobilis TaxID=1930276 RepID=A0A517MQP4_9BACT|nr:hypothetical protein [Adhaeretor mobilis]QDS97097.1 hypothetical protein HG15A2_03570 [Adhaeretor mobilis]